MKLRRVEELLKAVCSAPEGGCAGVTLIMNTRPETGFRVQELEVGAGQKSWVQSQTTFAALMRDEHAGAGGLRARVLKQKIWVEGVSYELQEIYGIDSLNSRRRVRRMALWRAHLASAGFGVAPPLWCTGQCVVESHELCE